MILTFQGAHDENPFSFNFLSQKDSTKSKKKKSKKKNNPKPNKNEFKAWVLLAGIILLTVSTYAYFGDKAPIETTTIKVIETSKGIEIVADSVSWERLTEEIRKYFQQKETSILELIEKAKTTQLTLVESTKLLAWLRQNKDSFTDELQALYLALLGGDVEKFADLKLFIEGLKGMNQELEYVIEYCFHESWIDDAKDRQLTSKNPNMGTDGPNGLPSFLYYMLSVNIYSGSTIIKSYTFDTDKTLTNVICFNAILQNDGTVWVYGYDVETLPPTKLPSNEPIDFFLSDEQNRYLLN